MLTCCLGLAVLRAAHLLVEQVEDDEVVGGAHAQAVPTRRNSGYNVERSISMANSMWNDDPGLVDSQGEE